MRSSRREPATPREDLRSRARATRAHSRDLAADAESLLLQSAEQLAAARALIARSRSLLVQPVPLEAAPGVLLGIATFARLRAACCDEHGPTIDPDLHAASVAVEVLLAKVA